MIPSLTQLLAAMVALALADAMLVQRAARLA